MGLEANEDRRVLNRRKFLCYTGASIGSLSLPTIGTASAQGESPGAKEIGIHQTVRDLIKNGRDKKAHKILEENDVEYSANKNVGGNVEDITTQAYYSKSGTEINNNSYHMSGNMYHSILSWDYELGNSIIDGRGTKDGASLSVSDAFWEPMKVYTSKENIELHKRGSHGYITKVAEPVSVGGNQHHFIEADFKKVEPGNHKIYGTYGHTWAVGGVYSGGVTFTLGPGPLGIGVSGTIDKWKIRSDAYL